MAFKIRTALNELDIKIPNNITMYCNTPETLKYLVETCGKTINDTYISLFAEKGYLCMIKYAVEVMGCKLDSDVMKYTIQENKLNCFKYIVEKDCQFNYDLSDFICAKGTIRFLKYIIELGHDISPSAIYFAYMNDNISCFKYLIEEVGIEPNPLLNDTLILKNNCSDYLTYQT